MNIQTDNTKKQATNAVIHTQGICKLNHDDKSKAELSWNNQDFSTLNMDALCDPLVIASSNEVLHREHWVFCAWIETWEKDSVKCKSDLFLDQCFKNKYCCYLVSWVHPDEPCKKNSILTAFYISKETGAKRDMSFWVHKYCCFIVI